MNPFRTSLLVLAGFGLLLCASLAPAAEQATEPLSKVKKNIEEGKAVLVDVREKSEWDQGHIKGAILLPSSSLQNAVDRARLDELIPRDKTVYTHCVVGRRAATAGNVLAKFGYEVRILKAGYKELVEAGFEKAKD